MFMDKQGTTYQLAENKTSTINRLGELTYVVRGVFAQPMPVEISPQERYVGIGFMMELKGSCVTKQTQIIRDVHVDVNGKLFAKDAMAREDTMSEVSESSPAGAALKIACGQRT